ncbi:MAG: spore coat protein GerQ [bacterium]|nr:spore coat protein GerQ [bacterium]
MNQGIGNNGFQNPTIIPSQSTYPPYMNMPNYNPNSSTTVTNNQSSDPQYVESIFSMNHGKRVSVYLSYPDSIEWRDRIFTGKILADGRDYLLLEDDQGKIILLWLIYINYAIFDEAISF